MYTAHQLLGQPMDKHLEVYPSIQWIAKPIDKPFQSLLNWTIISMNLTNDIAVCNEWYTFKRFPNIINVLINTFSSLFSWYIKRFSRCW